MSDPRFERVVTAIANLARPSVLYLSAWSAAISTVALAAGAILGEVDLIAAAAFITAAWGGVGLLYGAKSLEEGRKAKAEASVQIAREAPTGGRPWPSGDDPPRSE